MFGMGLGLGLLEKRGLSWQALSAYIEANAGIEVGVNPGVRNLANTGPGVLGVDYGTRTGVTQSDGRWGLLITSIASADAAIVHADYKFGVRTATKTFNALGEPVYTFTRWFIWGPSTSVVPGQPANANGTSTNHVRWSDAGSAIYHLKFIDCLFNQMPAQVGSVQPDMLYMDAPVGCTMTFEFTTEQGTGGNSNYKAAIYHCVKGTMKVLNSRATSLRTGAFTLLSGPNARIEFDQYKLDNDVGVPDNWNFNKPLFLADVAGGTVSLKRWSHDPLTAGSTLWNYGPHGSGDSLINGQDFRLEMDRVAWNEANRDVSSITPFTSGTAAGGSVVGNLGVYAINSRFHAGGSPNMFGNINGENAQGFHNWDFYHCEIYATNLAKCATTAVPPSAVSVYLMLLLGDGNNTTVRDKHTFLKFRWCRFKREYTPETLTDIENERRYKRTTAGCEVLELMHTSDCLIEFCWVDKCGEDAYELYTPFDRNTIRYSGAHANGQIVDCYGAGGWTLGANNLVHDIYGTSHTDCVDIDSMDNITVRNVYANNRNGGFVQNPGASRVRFHAQSNNIGSNVVVTGNMGDPATAFDDRLTSITVGPGITPHSSLSVTNGAGGTLHYNNDKIVMDYSTGTDSYPDDISGAFGTTFSATPSALTESPELTVAGISAACHAYMANGEFKIKRGAAAYGPWRTHPAIVSNGDKITLRRAASPNANTAVTCTLTLAGFSSATVNNVRLGVYTVDTTIPPAGTPYDHTITDTLNDGFWYEDLGTFITGPTAMETWFSTDGFSQWPGISFPNVLIPQGTTIATATLTIEVVDNYATFDTWRIFGEVPQTTYSRWSNSHLPDTAPAATGSNTGTCAGIASNPIGSKAINVLTLVQNMINGANFESGDGLNFWLLNTTIDNGYIKFGSIGGGGTAARLQITL